MQPDEKQNINIMELNMEIKNIKERLLLIPTKDEVKLVVKDAIEEALRECDNKYASKLTEKIVYTFAGMILTAVGGAAIYLVVR